MDTEPVSPRKTPVTRRPRRPGWIRIGLFVVIGAGFAWQGAYEVAALCLAAAAAVAWVDRKIALRNDSERPEG